MSDTQALENPPRLLGLIGWPVTHSLSPAMHNAALAALGLPWVYTLLPVPPGAVGDAIRGLRALGFVGANVTVPHKQAVIPFLDRLTPAAAAIGAVNTILLAPDARQIGDPTALRKAALRQAAQRQTALLQAALLQASLRQPQGKRKTYPTALSLSKVEPPADREAPPSQPVLDTPKAGVLEWPQLVGDNTDAPGFLADLRAHGVEVAGRQALVIGAGGASRAVVYALVAAGSEVVVLNRSLDHAHDVATMAERARPTHPVPYGRFPDDIAVWAERVDLIVNTTSLGMWPADEGLPWDPAVPFRPGQVVYDLVYTPRQTAFLRRAAADGARPIDGLGMLVEQGAAALALWTGQEPPVAVMRQAAERQLDKRFSA